MPPKKTKIPPKESRKEEKSGTIILDSLPIEERARKIREAKGVSLDKLATKKEVAQLKRGICILAVGIHGIAQAVLSGAGKQEFSTWLVSELKKAGFEIEV